MFDNTMGASQVGLNTRQRPPEQQAFRTGLIGDARERPLYRPRLRFDAASNDSILGMSWRGVPVTLCQR